MTESSFKAMSRVLDNYPELALWGFFTPERHLPMAEQRQRFEQDRAAMRQQRALDEFEAAQQWLRRWEVNPHWSSYGLKHKAEPAIGYVPNGIFIAAAAAVGLSVVRCGRWSPNANFQRTRELAGA